MPLDLDSIVGTIDFEGIKERKGEIVVPVGPTEIQLNEEHYVVIRPRIMKRHGTRR